jgi:hypothetical protein
LFFLAYGFNRLWRNKGVERVLALTLALPVLASWLSAVATIGDHRFRIPTMSLSLVLQIVGLLELKKRFSK